MTYAYDTIKKTHMIQDEETDKNGIGWMTDARWKAHYEMLVEKGVLKPMDYKSAFNLQFLPKRVSN
jgi:NitT/TauT family transport system substrate-binding protein